MNFYIKYKYLIEEYLKNNKLSTQSIDNKDILFFSNKDILKFIDNNYEINFENIEFIQHLKFYVEEINFEKFPLIDSEVFFYFETFYKSAYKNFKTSRTNKIIVLLGGILLENLYLNNIDIENLIENTNSLVSH